jgi:hypothetical protein
MVDRIVGGRIVHDRRSQYHMEPIQAIAEPILKELHPGIHKRAEDDIDQLPRLMYDGVWRDHSDEIIGDIHAFADFHPADDQRTDGAIKAWSQQCAVELEGEYSQSYYRVAVHVGLLAYVQHMRDLRVRMYCEHGWHRIVEKFHDACSGVVGYGFISASEKWGGLNLVYRCDPAAEERCREAERVAIECASHTCEMCGLSGELRRSNWRKTLCDRHWLDRKIDYSEPEFERLMNAYIAGKSRWQPLVYGWKDEGLSADQIYAHFAQQFGDLDEPDRRFWAVHCTRWCLLVRGREEGRPRNEGV